MDIRLKTFLEGVKACSPLLLGIFPFAMVAGATAVSLGFTFLAASGLSLIVFAGASQLAIMELMGRNAPALIIVLTALVINLRFVMYSAAMAPYFKGEKRGWKGLIGYLLTDQAFLLSARRFEDGENDPTRRRWFYLGTAMGLWTTWQAGTIAGILLGARAPDSLALDFAVPLSFIALLVPSIKDRATLVAALTGGAAILFTRLLPLNLGLIIAAFIGIAAGVIAERRFA